jgi:hypothetical protein
LLAATIYPSLPTGCVIEPRSCGIFDALVTSIVVRCGYRCTRQDAKRLFIYLKKSVDVTEEFGQQTEKIERFL